MQVNEQRTKFRDHLSGVRIAAAASLTILLAACSAAPWFESLDWGQCTDYSQEYTAEFQSHGELLSSVSTSTQSYAMALILSQDAVNSLFRRLSDASLPELSESAEVLGQRLTVSIQPRIPLLQIGGQGACPSCIQANVPFDVGLDLPYVDLPRGAGAIAVQMPIRLVPLSDAQTELVAEFQSVEVLGLQLNFTNELASNILQTVQPLVSRALTAFLQSRFQDASILTLDSWKIGMGEVVLAGRGPFVHPESRTIVIAMQSNLPIGSSAAIAPSAQLPDGADIGLVVHPQLLGSMARRMLFERVIPAAYDEEGNPQESGDTLVTMQSLGSTDDGLLRAGATIWRTGSMCGTADIAAAVAFQATPQGVSFALQDVEVTGSRGSGQILARADELAGGFLDALLAHLAVTVNYDQIFGGQRSEQPQMQTFQFGVDGRGLSLYLDLLD
ncbi:MAG: hypothetical protein JW797_06650 [Bradymonadales bacterium]|nr:hypothetical protein [Bradymonadales bacterium]